MADQIAPPSTNAPLTAEDAAIVCAEKQLDEDTRGRLVQVYGESKMAQGKHIAMRRPANQRWKCLKCGQLSDDIRKVCGNCLALEPGAGAQRPAHGRGRKTPASGSAAPAQPTSFVDLQPGETSDVGTELRTVPLTGRTYRQFTEAVGTAKGGEDGNGKKSLREQRGEGTQQTPIATADGGGGKGEEEDLYDDEPDCGEEGGVSCRPGRTADELEVEEEEDGGNDGSNGKSTASAGGGVLPEASTLNKEKHLPPERGSPFTHYVSLPVGVLSTVESSAKQFISELREYVSGVAAAEAQSQAADDDGNNSVDASHTTTHLSPELVSGSQKLHVTLLLLSLPNPQDVAFAKELLNIFAERWAAEKKKKKTQQQEEGIRIRFKRLHVMPERGWHGKGDGGKVNPKKASVVYMGLRDEVSTQAVREMQDLLHECFAELISEENRAEVERTKVNLHMTVMNKKWRHHGAKRPFDVTGVLEKFGEAVIAGSDTSDEAVLVPCVELNAMSGPHNNAGSYFTERAVPI